ncbi:MAG: hypothetical protein KAV87_61685 [Desulfobacteraceae bacterium]|nr:hypothetical protein [Desulfobacteraceae bacterium]
MISNDLFNYMRDATHNMQNEYDRIQKRANEDPGTAGDNGEENWAELLRKWLPASYHVVTKGRIMNTKGQCSPQVDVLVLSPSYPEALIGRKEYLEGGILAAFECKLTLKAEHIRTAVKNAAEIHRLSQPIRKGNPFNELHARVRYGLLSHSHVWKSEKSTPIENIEKNLNETEKIDAQHPNEVLDLICVSDLATWSTRKFILAGQKLLSQISARYKHLEDLWDSIQKAGGVIEAAHICYAGKHQSSMEKKQLFTPIGSFLANLLEMLAWEDPSLRSLAEYFILADLLGSGVGSGNMWILSVLSNDLADTLKKGGCLVSGQRWHEWSMIF